MHDHVVLAATVEPGEGVLLRVEADLLQEGGVPAGQTPHLLLGPLPVGDLVAEPVSDHRGVAGVAAGPPQGDRVTGHPVHTDGRGPRRH